jgi:2-keto-4-pentenoate hydratase/2-oxohepta-3-ene-1,7-dioic acid hydratase in catechol pathway
MKLCRFRPLDVPGDEVRTGVVEAGSVHEVRGDWPSAGSRTGKNWPLDRVRLLAPVTPSKIVCLGRNYKLHAAETKTSVPSEPLIFLKPPSSVIGQDDTIELPPDVGRVDYEGELAIVIGRRCFGLSEGEDFRPYVAGYTCLNDVSARELQNKDVLYDRAKGFDTFCPLGPVIETDLDWRKATIQTLVNGAQKQSAPASDMIYQVDLLVGWISRIMTLLPGDVIATGTPEGIGPIVANDVVEVVIEGIGRLRNPVSNRGAKRA